jgi:exopolysaccharide biosynthesis protein
MNKRIKYISAALAIILCIPVFSTSVIENVGIVRRIATSPLGDNATITEITMQHNSRGAIEERYIEFSPNSNLKPVVGYGNSIFSMSTITDAAGVLTTRDRLNVVAGINADFFNMSTGVPQGIVITEGILRKSDNGNWSVGFPDNGSPFISRPNLRITVTVGSGTDAANISVHSVNHTRNDRGVFLYTPDFSTNTRNTSTGTEVTLNISGQLRIGQPVTGTVREIRTATTTAAELTDGIMVLSAEEGTTGAAALALLQTGASVSVSVTSTDARWNTVPNAVGGWQKLVTDGRAENGLETAVHPRSAIGIRADGTTVLYMVDGRNPGVSNGMSLVDVANRLIALGCVEALNFDGGGSTAMIAAKPGETAMSIRNTPSDGRLRRSANYIFLVNRAARNDRFSRLFVYPAQHIMLRGRSAAFTALGTDSGYHSVPLPETAQWSTSSNDIITVDGTGRVLARGGGQAEVIASIGTVSGRALVTVVDTPDTIIVRNRENGHQVRTLVLDPGEVIDFMAVSHYNELIVPTVNGDYNWQIAGDIGTVTANGVFTATNISQRSGYLVVSLGSAIETIAITVGRVPHLIEDFERINIPAVGNRAFSLIRTTVREDVARGRGAGRLEYDFDEGNSVLLRVPADLPLPGKPSYLNLWVHGDNSRNVLGVRIVDEAGQDHDITVALMDFGSQRHVRVELPDNSVSISGFYMMRVNDQIRSGVVFIDHLMAAYGHFSDLTPPVISDFTVDSSEPDRITVTTTVTDNTAIEDKDISVTWNGNPVAFGFSAGHLSVNQPQPLEAGLHVLAIEAVDLSGNRTRRSVEMELTRPERYVFEDIDGNWARRYIQFLGQRGIVDGDNQFGFHYYHPDRDLTRLEMAVYISRLLRVDLTAYTNTVLPYNDVNEIPAEFRREVAAMFDMGIITGAIRNGELFFDSYANIRRGDFMTIIGRTLPKGYMGVPLHYVDAATIPTYMREHVAVLTALGVVSGNNRGELLPLSSITRAEAAKILCWMY